MNSFYQEVEEQKECQLAIMLAQAEIFEQQLEQEKNQLIIMSAIAEIYEKLQKLEGEVK